MILSKGMMDTNFKFILYLLQIINSNINSDIKSDNIHNDNNNYNNRMRSGDKFLRETEICSKVDLLMRPYRGSESLAVAMRFQYTLAASNCVLRRKKKGAKNERESGKPSR